MLTKFLKHLLLFLLLSNPIELFGQFVSEKSCYSVWNNLISSIGNNNPRPPELVLKNSEKNPASYNPKTSTVRIEKKILEICNSFGKDSLNALAYILAHELGHHYQNHGYHAKYASLDFSQTIDEKEENSNLRIDYESQADVYAGFYSHIAGYDALSVASNFLDKIYEEYKLPSNIRNYPSLLQRKLIIDKNVSDFNDLKQTFDLANLNLSIGNYDISRELYDNILDNGFTSREIYNNLGMSYIYEALDMGFEVNNIKLLIPFKTDLKSRLSSNSLSRSINSEEKILHIIEKAKNEFSLALTLDTDYEPAIQNLFYSKLFLKLIRNEKSTLEINDILNTKSCCENCVYGLLAFSENNKNKAKNIFKKGSENCVYCFVNQDFKKKNYNEIKKLNPTEFEMYDLKYNDIDLNCLSLNSSDNNSFYKKVNRLRLSSENKGDVILYKFKERIKSEEKCVSIHEYQSNNESYKNSLDIYIGNEIDDILKLEGKRFRLIVSGNKKYLTVIDDSLTFLIENSTVVKWYYNIRYN